MRALLFLLYILSSIGVFCQPSISFTVPGTTPPASLPSDVEPTSNWKNYYIVAFTKDASNNDIATNNQFTINISGLPLTSNTNVTLIMYGYDGTAQKIINLSSHTTNGSKLTCTFNSSTLNYNGNSIQDNTGIYIIQINVGTTTIALFASTFLVIEKTKEITITGASYKYLIHFIDNYFSGRKNKINTYLDELTNALTNSWKKEVTDWDLCKGLSSSIPENNSNFYDIYIVGFKWAKLKAFSGQYHTGNLYPASGSVNDNIRSIFIDCDISNTAGSSPETVLNEQELIYSIISHEFYHGIQWSHMSYNSLVSKFPDNRSTPNNETDDEFMYRGWLIEGQAKFLESVFMKDYSRTGTANILYSVGTNSESYGQKCTDFITHAIDQNYAFENMHYISYEYALFWRNIYEHFYQSWAIDKERLDILRKTCIRYNTVNSSGWRDILSIMDNQIDNASYTYNDFIEDLAKRVYFRDAVYKYWDDPNVNNFYSAITTSINENTTTWTTDAEFPSSGTTWYIPNILTFRTHKFKIQTPGTYSVAFNNVRTNKDNPLYSAKVYVFDNTKIYSSYDINFIGSAHYICAIVPSTPAGNKYIVVIVTWQGNADNNINLFNYNIAITKSAPVSNYTMAVDATQPPFTVKFANNPPFPYAQFLEWGFGESAPIPSIIAVSPTHLYSPGKYFTLTQSTRNCNGYIVDTKNAGIAFVPYIQDLSVTNQTTNAAYAQYTRTISGGNLVFNKMGNYLIPARQKILIKANVYGFVDYLKLMVLDNAGNTVLTSDGVYNTTDNTYHFNILSQQLRTGVNKLKFTGHFTISSVDYPIPSGTDPLASERAGHDIYNRTDNISLSSYPAKLNTWNITNWAAYTGPDDNYSITVEAPLLSDQYMEIILDSDCTNLIFKATFYIHSVPDGSKLDFGDKITTLVSPNTVVNHTYTRDPDIISKYLVKLSDPSGQPIMSRLIYFSIR